MKQKIIRHIWIDQNSDKTEILRRFDMKDKDIKWDDVNSLDKITGLFERYCFLNSCC